MGIPIGVRNLYVAIMTNETAETYDAPTKVDGLFSVKVNPNSSTTSLYGDNTIQAQNIALGNIDVEIVAKEFPATFLASVLGHSISGATIIKKKTDLPPYVALGYEETCDDGTSKYHWLYKGKFMLPESNIETQAENVKYQTPTMKAQFTAREADYEWERVVDTAHPDFVAGSADDFFTSVTDVAKDIAAPTVVTVPADTANNIVVSANLTVTFNKTMALSTLIGANIFLTKDSDNSLVACALSVDTARKVVTLNPSSDLSAGTTYTLVVTAACKTVWGTAAPMTMSNFTTAA